jgi:ATPase subunit of ABC transporter with duplicated ATPase domains
MTEGAKGYGDRLLIHDLSYKRPRGGIVGVIGPNGAGKTTLFNMLTGQGVVKIGDSVRLGYVDQSRSHKIQMSFYWMSRQTI